MCAFFNRKKKIVAAITLGALSFMPIWYFLGVLDRESLSVYIALTVGTLIGAAIASEEDEHEYSKVLRV